MSEKGNKEYDVFNRDVDKLLRQYKNLRLKIYSDYKDYFPDPVSKSELKSYIDEQFTRLVKEYDINGEVDFPGYIKTKLNLRVRNGYVKREYRDRSRVFVPKNDFYVSNLLDQSPEDDAELGYYEALEYALRGVELSDLEKYIAFYILQEEDDSSIEKKTREEYKNDKKITVSLIKRKIKEMNKFLEDQLRGSLKM